MNYTSLKKGEWKEFIDLVRRTKPSKLILTFAVSMSILNTLVGLVIPLFTKNLVDNFSLSSLNPIIITALMITFIAQAFAGGLSLYLLNKVGQNVVANLRNRLWKKFLLLPIYYYDNHRIGEMISQMVNDTGVIKGLITNHMTRFFTGIISIIGSVTILLILDWKMTLIILMTVPICLIVIIPSGRKMHSISRGVQKEAALFTTVIEQVLSQIRLVKYSYAEPMELKKGENNINNLYNYGIREGKVQALISPLMSSVSMLILVIIIGYGGMRVSSGILSTGDLVAFILYLFQMFTPLTNFTTFFTQIQKARGATERIIKTLEHNEDDYESGKLLQNVNDSISVENLTFAYNNTENVLKNINFTANPGKVTAIVGPSGGGKTTLFSLLERFYKPLLGTIKLGDTSIEEFSLSSWRSHIGYVSQESPIIAGTIQENITYGLDRYVSDSEIQKVSEMAYAHQFISELPDKYDTQVGERGIKLSGGQRQRIGIARALLRNPYILMLDEATSNLDSKSEIYVQNALENLMHGRTTFVIAHRLSTVVGADQIIFIEKGSITGQGTHEELFKTHAMYREFANQQLYVKEFV